MKKIIFILAIALVTPSAFLLARGGSGHEGGGGERSDANYHGGEHNNFNKNDSFNSYHGNDNVNRVYRYSGPENYGGGYGYPGYSNYNPNYQSDPGSDVDADTNSLYDAYLKSDPKIPSPM